MTKSSFLYPQELPGFPAEVPSHQRVWRQRETAVLKPGEAALWRFDACEMPPASSLWLRLIPSLDCRVPMLLTARTGTGKFISRRSLGWPTEFEPLDLPLDPELAGAIAAEGLELTLESERPLYVHVAPGAAPHGGISRDVLSSGLVIQPSNVSREQLRQAFAERICSLGALSALGWMAGCVYDGLWAMHKKNLFPGLADGLDLLLKAFFTDTEVHYESPTSTPLTNVICNVEGGLPWAILNDVQPDHPSLDMALEYFRTHASGFGNHYSCEGNYTFTYPMMAIALSRGLDDLVAAGWENYRSWQVALRQPDGLYLRNGQGRLTYRNWARGWCWYMMGQVRGLEAAAISEVSLPKERLADLADCVRCVLAFQRTDGLWGNFLDEPAQQPDTGGSAGIACAMVLAAKHGWLEPALARQAVAAGQRTHDVLWDYVTADGYLTGVAPSNKCGTALQRLPDRSLQQFGLGLMASLVAAVAD